MSNIQGTESIVNPLQKSKLYKKGLCDYVINVASGCLHGCTFCYVPSTPAIRSRQKVLQTKGVDNPQLDWGKYLFIRQEVPEKLEKILSNKRTWVETPAGKGVVLLCSGTDPYQNQTTATISRQTITILLKYNKRVRLLTRSSLWTKDFDILAHPNVTIGMSLPFLDDELARQIEPYAPPTSQRYEALKRGYEAGCRMYVAVAPTPPTMTLDDFKQHLERVMAINPEVIFWEPINARGSNGTRMLKAGLNFTKTIMHKNTWAENFIRQWQNIEQAAAEIGCLDRLHIWVDPALKGIISEDRFYQWYKKPTVEQWKKS